MNYQFINKLKALSFIDEIWLFGSRSRGDNQERSDIDIAILCPNATDKEWLRVSDIIDEADTLLKIDYIRFDKLNDTDKIKQNIIKHKKVIFKKMKNWKDYFDSLGGAIKRLSEVIRHEDAKTNEFMQDAAIQRFEFVIELFWKVLKKILSYEKVESTTPRDVLSKSFQFKLIDDEKIWLSMLDVRNNTSHVYKQEDARKVFNNIQTYLLIFEKTYEILRVRYS